MKPLLPLLLLTAVYCHPSTLLLTKYQGEVLSQGSSAITPKPGQSVLVHFTSSIASSAQQLHSTRDGNRPYRFVLDERHTLACWQEVLAEMAVGDRVRVRCPASLVFGGAGLWNVRDNSMSDLQYDIEMLEIAA